MAGDEHRCRLPNPKTNLQSVTMKMRSLFLLPLIAAAAALAASGATPSANPMKAKNQKEAEPYCPPDEKSACGLPSKVVIDMSKAKVQHTDAEWKTLLTADQFQVARKQGTEMSFRNEYWN